MSAATIELRNLVVDYSTASGTTRAVDALSLSIATGEVYALLGENGAGKTSTIEVLEGHRARTAGDVVVLGVDPANRGSAGRQMRDRIGVVLQTSGLEREVTVRESVALFSSVYRNPRSLEEVLALVGLTDVVDQRVGTLSGGQRRRLDLGLAVVGRPEVLFLDEPTTGFDPSARHQAWELITSLRSDGTTVLLTTHYLDEAEHLADRVGVLSHGRLLLEGRPSDLVRASAATDIVVRTGDARTIDSAAIDSLHERLEGVAATMDQQGSELRVSSVETSRALEVLTQWSNEFNVALDDWSIERPTLEQVFLKVTESAERHVDE